MKSTLLDATKLPMSRAEAVVNPTFCVWSISHWHGLCHHNQVWDNCCWCTWRQIKKHIPKNTGHTLYIVLLDGAVAAGLPELRLHLLWHRIWRCWEQRGRKIPIQDKIPWIHILFLAQLAVCLFFCLWKRISKIEFLIFRTRCCLLSLFFCLFLRCVRKLEKPEERDATQTQVDHANPGLPGESNPQPHLLWGDSANQCTTVSLVVERF